MSADTLDQGIAFCIEEIVLGLTPEDYEPTLYHLWENSAGTDEDRKRLVEVMKENNPEIFSDQVEPALIREFGENYTELYERENSN